MTDADDPLAWDRADHEGWAVGLHLWRGEQGEASCFRQTQDGSVDALVLLLDELLPGGRTHSE